MQTINILRYQSNSPTFKAQLTLKDRNNILQEAERETLNCVAKQIGDENDSIFIGCQRFLNEDKSAYEVEAFVSVTIGEKIERGIITNQTTSRGEALSKDFCTELINLIAVINRDMKKEQAQLRKKTEDEGMLNKLIGLFK